MVKYMWLIKDWGIYNWREIIVYSFHLLQLPKCFSSLSVFSTRAVVYGRITGNTFSVEMVVPTKTKWQQRRTKASENEHFWKCNRRALRHFTHHITSQYNLICNYTHVAMHTFPTSRVKPISSCLCMIQPKERLSVAIWSWHTAWPLPTAHAMPKDIQEDANTIRI